LNVEGELIFVYYARQAGKWMEEAKGMNDVKVSTKLERLLPFVDSQR